MSDQDSQPQLLVPAATARDGGPPPPVLRAVADLCRIDFARHDLRGVLGQVAGLARTALAPDGEVSVTLLRGKAASTATFTGQPALSLDETQYAAGFGPCLDAAGAGQTLLVADMATETRWPAFTAAALQAGIGSSLSLALPVSDGVTGALNVGCPAVRPRRSPRIRATS